ncbi:MAG TPA: hypothetical protein VK821_02640, partial [Dehalococcoidia bacterium]|nr:hypothetical protein [Dehalococcoidia bacterium]
MVTGGTRSTVIDRRFSRRRALQGGSLAGAGLAAALAACGGRGQPGGGTAAKTSGAASAQPRKGGVLVHVGGNGPSGSYDISSTQLDPHINTPPAARGFRLVYQGLLGYDLRTYEVQ